VVNISILDDDHKPTRDFVFGRPLVRVKVWINGDLVLQDGYGLIDTGSRHSSICKTKIGINTPDEQITSHDAGGDRTTGCFNLAAIQIDQFAQFPVRLTTFGGKYFHVIVGRDVLRRFVELRSPYQCVTHFVPSSIPW
jgi:hypothetical protein